MSLMLEARDFQPRSGQGVVWRVEVDTLNDGVGGEEFGGRGGGPGGGVVAGVHQEAEVVGGGVAGIVVRATGRAGPLPDNHVVQPLDEAEFAEVF